MALLSLVFQSHLYVNIKNVFLLVFSKSSSLTLTVTCHFCNAPMNATNTYKRKAPPTANSKNNNAAHPTAAIAAAGSNNSGSISRGESLAKPGSHPTTLTINNIPVHFPFKPYDVQSKYMKSVLDALQGSQHALLESPTVSFFS